MFLVLKRWCERTESQMFENLNKYIDRAGNKYPEHAKFIRYGFFGGLSTGIDLIVFYVLIEFFAVKVRLAVTTAFMIGVLFHYLFVHTWVYTGPFYGSKLSRYINFLLVNALALVLTISIFHFFVKHFHPHTKTMLLLIRSTVSVIVGILSYSINTMHVFKKNTNLIHHV